MTLIKDEFSIIKKVMNSNAELLDGWCKGEHSYQTTMKVANFIRSFLNIGISANRLRLRI